MHVNNKDEYDADDGDNYNKFTILPLFLPDLSQLPLYTVSQKKL